MSAMIAEGSQEQNGGDLSRDAYFTELRRSTLDAICMGDMARRYNTGRVHRWRVADRGQAF